MRIDPEALLEELTRHGVRFLIIGGIAGTLHGSPYPTDDLDICPQDGEKNLERLARCLEELEAKEWDPRKEIEVRFEWTPETLKVDKTWILRTEYGHLDILFEPSGTQGYRDLSRDKVQYELGAFTVDVVSVEGLIRMKEAAGRERDLEQLPTLRKLMERGSQT